MPEIDKSKIKAVVFDLDGTLLDTLEDLMISTNYALEKNGMPQRTLDEVRRFVGNGVQKLMERAIDGGLENPLFDQAFADFKEHYKLHCKDHTGTYPGIMELLDELQKRGYQMAIVSNKFDPAVKELEQQFFKGYMDTAIGEMEGVRRKPAPDTVNKALEEMHVDKANAIYVGDSDVDVATAANSGLACVSVLWGFRDEEFLKEHGAKTFIHKPMELLKVIN